MKFTLLLLCFMIIAGSCKKLGIQPLEGEYVAVNTITITETKMFTAQGTITDKQIIRRFIEGRHLSGNIDPDITSENNNSAISIVFTPLTASIHVDSRTSEAQLNYLSDKKMLLISKDSLQKFTPTVKNRCDLIAEKIYIDNPFYVCKDMPSQTGFSSFCKYREQVPIEINNGQPSILLTSVIGTNGSSGSANNCLISNQNFWKHYNNDLSKHLVTGDTVVIQAKSLTLIKR
jgi:hypothetical protein